MFRSILAATDFSPGAERAVTMAVGWAARQESRLEIVHVFDHPVRAIPSGTPWLNDDAETEHGRVLGDHLEREVSRARASIASATGVLLRGKPHAAIVERARESGADLIVVGARGLGRVQRTLLGSVADRVLRTAPTSVLVVPEEASVASVPRVILVPTDFSGAAGQAVERATKFAGEIGASMEIVHAWELPSIDGRHDGIAEDIRGAALAKVKHTYPPTDAVRVRHHAREGAPTDVILALVHEVHADLIAIAPTGQRNLASWLLGSITDRVVRTSPVPVLVLRGASAT